LVPSGTAGVGGMGVLEIGLTVFGRRIFRAGFAFVRVLGDFLKKVSAWGGKTFGWGDFEAL